MDYNQDQMQQVQQDPQMMQMLQQEAQLIQQKAQMKMLVSKLHKECFLAHAINDIRTNVPASNTNIGTISQNSMKLMVRCVRDKVLIEEKVREAYSKAMGQQKGKQGGYGGGFKSDMGVPPGARDYIR